MVIRSTKGRTREQREKEKALLKTLAIVTPAPQRSVGDDVLDMLPEEERVVLTGPMISPATARRVIAFFLKEVPPGVIGARTQLTLEQVNSVIKIVNLPCLRCGKGKVGTVTLVTPEVPMCRKCRIAIEGV